ncbi:hypothetical protein [Bacillus piscicola]|uniref:hypothetical protein n=1 Tax=Bacillus piscicola TaxID=1632684 RepID=UPI001F091904|nr:hypothetical protein [Bacillus piscicola]
MRREIKKRGLEDVIHTARTRCNGCRQDNCVLIVYPKGDWYKDLKLENAPKFIEFLCENKYLTNSTYFLW